MQHIYKTKSKKIAKLLNNYLAKTQQVLNQNSQNSFQEIKLNIQLEYWDILISKNGKQLLASSQVNY